MPNDPQTTEGSLTTGPVKLVHQPLHFNPHVGPLQKRSLGLAPTKDNMRQRIRELEAENATLALNAGRDITELNREGAFYRGVLEGLLFWTLPDGAADKIREALSKRKF